MFLSSSPMSGLMHDNCLRVHMIFASVAHLLGELVHHIFEYHWVNVLAQQVHEEPVADEGLFHDDLYTLSPDPSIADFHQVGPHCGGEDNHDAIDNDK